MLTGERHCFYTVARQADHLHPLIDDVPDDAQRQEQAGHGVNPRVDRAVEFYPPGLQTLWVAAIASTLPVSFEAVDVSRHRWAVLAVLCLALLVAGMMVFADAPRDEEFLASSLECLLAPAPRRRRPPARAGATPAGTTEGES